MYFICLRGSNLGGRKAVGGREGRGALIGSDRSGTL